ncbi:hypothetical protein [Marinobacter salarius]|uniref:Uncharacterized protein n=1 Tax=Marinobacter salarius TaxID=1420917 RepID=A0A1W6KG23_9GAMM|nr:hypothetical protein [Marinobacter salarius]ARM86269.1 hypothetical protein MARSALSMR5_04252 [Marinobacter salarius]
MENSKALPELSAQEKAVLNTFKEWFGDDPNTTVYLAGSRKGSIEIDEQGQSFELREEHSLSEDFVQHLMSDESVQVVDARVSGEQTLDLMNEIAKGQFKPALMAAAAANDEGMDLDDGENFSPGM